MSSEVIRSHPRRRGSSAGPALAGALAIAALLGAAGTRPDADRTPGYACGRCGKRAGGEGQHSVAGRRVCLHRLAE